MKKLNRKYAAFELPDGFILEIVGTDIYTDYYISHEDYGVKSLCFGGNEPFDKCLNELENDLVDTDYTEYMDDYREEYMDADPEIETAMCAMSDFPDE